MMGRKEVQAEVAKKGRKRRRGRKVSARGAKTRRETKSVATVASEVLASPVKCAVHAFLFKYMSSLRKVPSQLPPKIRAGPPSKRVKRVSWSKWPAL